MFKGCDFFVWKYHAKFLQTEKKWSRILRCLVACQGLAKALKGCLDFFNSICSENNFGPEGGFTHASLGIIQSSTV